MQQPPSYVNASYLDYVYRLHKSLYGLKQAPRACFKRFTSHFLYLGFIASIVDRSLFVIHTPHVLLYLLLYVDDIIIKSPNLHHIAPLVTVFGHAFELKDLGPLNYFLGIQITPTSIGIALNQSKYALDLLHEFDMDNVKPIKTPCYPSIKLISIFGHLLSDPSSYCNMIGGLQYLTFTRPDLSYAVHQLCQFTQFPTDQHLVVAKRVLRYVRGTLITSIQFNPGQLTLSAFIDAD